MAEQLSTQAASQTPTPWIADVATRAPVACVGGASCGDDLTLAEAQQTYAEAGPRFVPRSMTDGNTCNAAETRGDYYGWAPSDKVVDGAAALTRLTEHARSGQPFNRRYVIIEADRSASDEQHLALCLVTQVGDVVGPPRQCATVAILTRGGAWLRTGDSDLTSCYAGTSFRPSGAIDIRFDVLTRAGLAPLSASLLKMLQSELKLSSEENRSVSSSGSIQSIEIRSATGPRTSEVLPGGWREAVDFDVTMRVEEGKVRIEGAAHALVCRQALGSFRQYQGMDDAQRATYAAFLDARVDAAIKAACPGYVRRDARTVQCDDVVSGRSVP
jgi:hypothetical protein